MTTRRGTIVIDPGHGGAAKVGNSSHNNAVSASGVPEKHITLQIALLTREAIEAQVAAEGHEVNVVLTRESDVNLGLAQRAQVAKAHGADLFLSIHCNGFDGSARGVETLVRPTEAGNPNHDDDLAFATAVKDAVFLTIKKRDAGTKDRGVKKQQLGVLRDQDLGPGVKACLLELEFIDVPAVDKLLNVGISAPEVRREIAQALARTLIDNLPAA